MNYNNLFKECQKNTEIIRFNKERELRNKKLRLKNRLFNDILFNVNNVILKRSKEGYESAIVFDDEYNEILVEYLNELREILKPFKLIYKKKTFDMKSLFEIIVDDTNYVLIIDWSQTKSDRLNKKWLNFSKKICFNKAVEDYKNINNKWTDFYKKICILEAKKYINNTDDNLEAEWGFVNMIYNK